MESRLRSSDPEYTFLTSTWKILNKKDLLGICDLIEQHSALVKDRTKARVFIWKTLLLPAKTVKYVLGDIPGQYFV